MAQDILDYECAKYILTHDIWVDEETQTEKEMYNINPYAFSTAIMGALQEEIKKQEILEQRVNTVELENQNLKQELAELKATVSTILNNK